MIRFILACLLWLGSSSVFAQTVTPLYTYEPGPGANPQAGLTLGSDGNYYGATTGGGTYGLGTVFRVSSVGGLTVLHAFNGTDTGATPTARLLRNNDGSFYGTTYWGGANDLGTIFKITPTGTLTTLYSFNSSQGANPQAGLIQGNDGNFYGTTYGGGVNNLGTIFKITPTGSLTTLHSFGGLDGRLPYAGLVQGSDGNFYGTTYQGGTAGFGTIYKLTPEGFFSTVYSFVNASTGGRSPRSSLVEASDGNFYGTTQAGGSIFGGGTIYRFSPTTNAVTTLYALTGINSDGAAPYGELALGSDGNLYGTATGGGVTSNGTFFRMTLTGTYTNLYQFTGTATGRTPYAGVILGGDGNFYGTTYSGGAYSQGTVYKISQLGFLTSVAVFPGGTSGGLPSGDLFLDSDGTFYGTTATGGQSGAGTLFAFKNNIFTALGNFVSPTTGASPQAGVVLASDGSFYGTTSTGGASSQGTIYKYNPTLSPPTLSTVYAFAGGINGARPLAPLALGNDGTLYGTTAGGGGPGFGTIYRLNLVGAVTTLYTFPTGGASGSSPRAGLTLGGDGNFYGTTSGGGVHKNGTVFQFSPSTSTLTSLYSFNQTDGAQPEAELVLASDGNFYGTTAIGGTANAGTVFRISPTGVFTFLYAFTGGVGGATPLARLSQASDGNFYGTTTAGGAFNEGLAFRLTPAGVFTALYSFTGASDGAIPLAGLVPTTAGSFVGLASEGGTHNTGTLFQLNLPPTITSINPGFGGIGTTVILTGQYLSGSTQVAFGGVAATFTVDSPTQITTTVPTGAVTGSITVTTPGGTVSSSSFTVFSPPVLTSFFPPGGTVSTLITLTGSSLSGTTEVRFNGILAPNFTIVSDSEISVNVPVGATDGPITVTSLGGTATSGTSFAVFGPPVITSQPQSVIIDAGQTVTLSVTATGGNLTYQWYQGNSGNFQRPIATATGNTYTTPPQTSTLNYWVQVNNTLGTANSNTATVSVGGPPVIVTQPQATTIDVNQTATLSVTATGQNLRYQWYQGNSGNTNRLIAGATGASYTTAALTVSSNYWVRVTNNVSSVDSITVTVVVGLVPMITAPPTTTTILSGQTATLSVTVTGTAPIYYQWFQGPTGNLNNPITGATNSSLTTPALTTTTNYWVRVSNSLGSADSATTTVVVSNSGLPVIITQPVSPFIDSGNTATLSVTASGASPLTYQWYFGPTGNTNRPITGATSSSYTTDPLTTATNYWVRVSNSLGRADSTTTTVVILNAGTPVLITQPVGATIISGQTATLGVSATGAATLSYQWYQGPSGNTNNPIAGATSTSYTTPALTTSTNYWVRVSNSLGNADSSTTSVVVSDTGPPLIALQPYNPTITNGQTATLGVTATGAVTLSYQWYQGLSGNTNNPILGATSSLYTTPALTAVTNYWVRVSNSLGNVNSNTATVAVQTLAVPTLTSISPGPARVGTPVILTGTGFSGATLVRFNTGVATYTVNSSTQITAVVPLGATTGKISVTTGGGTATSPTDFVVIPYAIKAVTWQMVGAADFNQDGSPDILWRNYTTGENEVWLMNGFTYVSTVPLLSTTDITWQLVGAADFTADGKPDLLWRNYTTGQNAVWQMNGTTFVQSLPLDTVTDLTWQLIGPSDLTNDGKPDLVWRNYLSGENYVWQMNGTSFINPFFLGTVTDPSWQPTVSGDLTNDGLPDLLWRNVTTGEVYAWQLNGYTYVQALFLGIVADPNWQVVGTADFNRDGQTDLMWRNVGTGESALWFMSGYTYQSAVLLGIRPAQ